MLVWITLILMANIIGAIAMLQLPAVQTEVIKMLTTRVSARTGFTISISKVAIDWLDQATLGGVSIVDQQGETMIEIEELTVDYKLSTLFSSTTILLDELNLVGPTVNLISDENHPFNINSFVTELKNMSSSDKKSGKTIRIDHVNIEGGTFSLDARQKSKITDRFDHNHFTLENISAELSAFNIRSDTIAFTTVKLATRDLGTGLTVHDLKTNFEISNSRMLFDDLDGQIGSSHIRDSLIFTYTSMQNLSYFTDSVEISANLKSSHLYSRDLAYFVPYFKTIKEQYRFSGQVRGKVGSLNLRNFDLVFGRNSYLRGRASFDGLPDISNTFIDISLRSSEIFEQDLNQYVKNEAFEKYNRFDQVRLRGAFTGYLQDFVATGTFDTNLGRINSDVNLKIGENAVNTAYTGQLQLTNFNIGEYSGSKQVGLISMNGKIGGRGLSLENADFVLNGNITELQFNGYEYHNISLNAELAQEFIDGTFRIDDPNLKFEAGGRIDFRDRKNIIDVNGALTFANLDELNLVPKDASLSAKIDIAVTGFHVDSILGNAYLSDIQASYDGRALEIDTLTLTSQRDSLIRMVELKSNRIDVAMSGDFNFSTAYKDLKELIYEYGLNLVNDPDSIAAFYANRSQLPPEEYTIKLTCDFHDINKSLNLLIPQIYLSENSHLEGYYRHGSNTNLNLFFKSDTLKWDNLRFFDNELTADASKFLNRPEILAAADFISQHQETETGAEFDELIASAVWENDFIDFNFQAKQEELNNIADFYGIIELQDSGTAVKILPSNLQVLNKKWQINQANNIFIQKDRIQIDSLQFINEDEFISAQGVISLDSLDIFNVIARNFDLSLINPLISKELGGRVNGSMSVADLYRTPVIQTDFYIEDFLVNDLEVGLLSASSFWDNNLDKFNVNLTLEKNDFRELDITGFYDPWNSETALDLTSKLTNADLAIAEPFMANILTDVGGTISGEFKITGPLLSPNLLGQGVFKDGQLRVGYIKTLYRFNGGWSLDSEEIKLNDMQLTDQNNRTSSLDAIFRHEGFRNFNMDLQATMNNFMVLDTKKEDNDLFYGTAVATGNLRIAGPFENIMITSTARTERGTRIFLPMNSNSSASADEFISFTNFTDTLNAQIIEDANRELKVTGLSMKLDVEITPDAYAELIFDQTVGDIIRGVGRGNLSLEIDTKGDFNMFGEYQFVEGGYNFTMYNIVNKEFEIEPDSKITFSGDPYTGIVDINAIYEVITSLQPLIDTVYHDQPDVKRNYPSQVILKLQGPLLSPNIDFDIIIEDYPRSNVDMDTQIRAFLNKIEADEQELNRQVFSLLVLRNYSPPNSFQTGGTIGSSVSEFISNQLSYWISQVDDNLTIDIDLGQLQLDENAFNTFQLRVSYAFLDGNLIVTRDGGFTDPTTNQATVASIAGDWTVEYLLSKDGKLRIKLFKKTNYNQLNAALGNANQSVNAGGFSLIYTTSFDRIRDIFNGKKKKEKKNSKESDSDTAGLRKNEEEAEEKGSDN